MELFEQVGGGVDIVGTVGDDLLIDMLFEDEVLTGFTFLGYIILEPLPLEKRYALTVTNTDLAEGQIQVSLSDTQTTEIGPISGRPWYLQWTDTSGNQRNVLMGSMQLNRI